MLKYKGRLACQVLKAKGRAIELLGVGYPATNLHKD